MSARGSRAKGRGSRGGTAGADEGPRVVVGRQPVRELLRAEAPVRRVLLAEAGRGDAVAEIRRLAERAGVAVADVERDEIDELVTGQVHQGVAAVAEPFAYAEIDRLLDADPPALLVALDSVTDPHNLGSIARSAEAVGADGLLIPGRRAAGVTTTVEKAAAGALAHLPVARVTNLVRTLKDLQRRGLWVVGLDGEAEQEVDDCPLLDQPLVLVVGAEGGGLARLTRETCDALVRLPMRGHVGSLNASVAAAVALYATRRARDRA